MNEMSAEAREAANEYQRRKRNEMSAGARAALNEYQRRWRAANPDKVRAKNVRYWENKAAKMAADAGKGKDEQTQSGK